MNTHPAIALPIEPDSFQSPFPAVVTGLDPFSGLGPMVPSALCASLAPRGLPSRQLLGIYARRLGMSLKKLSKRFHICLRSYMHAGVAEPKYETTIRLCVALRLSYPERERLRESVLSEAKAFRKSQTRRGIPHRGVDHRYLTPFPQSDIDACSDPSKPLKIEAGDCVNIVQAVTRMDAEDYRLACVDGRLPNMGAALVGNGGVSRAARELVRPKRGLRRRRTRRTGPYMPMWTPGRHK